MSAEQAEQQRLLAVIDAALAEAQAEADHEPMTMEAVLAGARARLYVGRHRDA